MTTKYVTNPGRLALKRIIQEQEHEIASLKSLLERSDYEHLRREKDSEIASLKRQLAKAESDLEKANARVTRLLFLIDNRQQAIKRAREALAVNNVRTSNFIKSCRASTTN